MQRHKNILSVSRWERSRGVGQKGEGSKNYKLVLTEYSWDVKDSIENMVNIVITVHSARWVLDLSG